MKDERKTKAQLIAELSEARQRVTALETAETARQWPDAARQRPDAARQHAEDALRTSEERYRSLLEQASDGIFVADSGGNYTDVNSMGCAMLGYTRDEILQRSMQDLVNQDELALSPFKLADMQAGKMVLNERHMRRKDGSLVPVEISGRLLSDGRLLGLVRDITERKQAEKEIESLSRFPAENPNPVLRVGSDGVLLYANRASDVILRDWGCAVGERVPAFWQAVAAAFAEQSSEYLDVPLADRVWSFFMTPVVEASYINLYGLDITERKQAEARLRQSENTVRAWLNAIQESAFLIDREGLVLAGNATMAQRLRHSIEELVGACIYDFIPPQTAHTRRLYVARVIETGEPVRFEDERFGRIIDNFIYPVFDQAGQVKQLAILGTDITDRKQMEDTLRESEDKFKYVFDNSVIG